MRGAVGVGGLVITETLTASGVILKTSYPAYDGNGNVTAVVENIGNTATVVATYRYDAYGQLIATTGDPSKSAYRFSTKPYDELTGLYYYGYRYYDPVTGRWPSRDPIGERGGTNLYGFVYNNSFSLYDYLGENPKAVAQVPSRGWSREQWQDWAKKNANKFPPGHGMDEIPTGFPHYWREENYPLTDKQPIAWGTPVDEFPDGLKTEGEEDKAGSPCKCQKAFAHQSFGRPHKRDGTRPIPGGRGDQECEMGKIVVLRYDGKCVPGDAKGYVDDCGDCDDSECFYYIEWTCGKGALRGTTGWGASKTTRFSSCKKKK